jgi:hypothetical protein
LRGVEGRKSTIAGKIIMKSVQIRILKLEGNFIEATEKYICKYVLEKKLPKIVKNHFAHTVSSDLILRTSKIIS